MKSTPESMQTEVSDYRVWGSDDIAYGPVDLPTLTTWISDGRVTADDWIFAGSREWLPAAQWPELKPLFQTNVAAPNVVSDAPPSVKPGSLRRIKVFADMDQLQLESLLKYLEVVRFPPFAPVVKKGEHGDAIFFVLEGELRAFTMIDGKETTFSTMGVGESFGEISVLDHGPRSADVVANVSSTLLKISSARVEHLLREAPALAAPFLYALSRSIVKRLRGLTKKYEDSIHFSRTARVGRE